MDWLWSPFPVVAISYGAALVAWFAFKLNRDQAMPTEHGTDADVDAVEFFWRPG